MKYRHATNLWIMAAIAALGVSAAAARGTTTWQGPGGHRGDGNWGDAANWSGSATPDSTDDVTIQGIGADDPADATTANIVIGQDDGEGGVTPIDAKAKTLTVQYGKTATLTLATGSSLAVSGIVQPGASGDTYGSRLTIQGANSGTSAVNLGRIEIKNALATPNVLTLTGSHLDVTVTPTGSNSSHIQDGNILLIDNGASLTQTANTIYIYGNSNNGRASRMTIANGAVTAPSLIVRDGQLLQLGAQGTLDATVTAGTWSGGASGSRFEAEGQGLKGVLQIDQTAALAIGVSPITGMRTSAATLKMNNILKLQNNGHLEFGIFGAGGSDSSTAANLAGVSNDLLDLNDQQFNRPSSSYGNTLLDIVTYGYTPQIGQTYQLIAGAGQMGTGYTFTLGNTDSSTWKITQDATGLYVTRVPEPAGLGLLAFGGLLAVRRRKK